MKKYDFTINGSDYSVELKSIDDNNVAKILVNGTPYNVEIKTEVKTPKTPVIVRKDTEVKAGENSIRKASAPVETSKRPSAGEVKSPLPGTIFKILVRQGDPVKAGDTLLIMESMKMENNILSEKTGVVKRILVSEGQAILQNDTLLEIE